MEKKNVINQEKKKLMFPNANKGVPVEKGKNWVTGLTNEQRQEELLKHENKWRTKYNANRAMKQNFMRG